MAEAVAHFRSPAAPLDAEDDRHESEWLGDRSPSTPELVVAGAALGVSAAAAGIVVSGGVVADPTGFSIVLVSNILCMTGGGLLWLRARPWSPFGRLLLALAGASAVASLAGSPTPELHVVGVLVQWLLVGGVAWAVVAFPSGRLDAAGRVLVAATVAMLLVQVPELLVSEAAAGSAGAASCTTNCPANPLLVASKPGLAHGFDVAEQVARFCWAAAISAVLAVRYARASRPRRRIVLPVYAVALLWIAAFGIYALVAVTAGRSSPAADAMRVAVVATRIVLPLGFIAAILLAHAYAGTALVAMARELGSGPSVATVEDIVRRALDDPRARLAFWLPRLGRFADRHGRDARLERALEWRTWRSFGRGGERVLALEHDAALAEDPELVQAVGSATLLALENRRLQQDLLDSIDALRASQRRLVVATAAERRKIERDLHDSTQQKLVAIRIQLELAREQAPVQSGLRSRLAELGKELDDALDELRAVAHGIYPQLLADAGLAPALHEAARRVLVPVELDLDDVGRLPEVVEAAVYYCCLEALQNVAKHGGEDVGAVVRLRLEGRTLRFSVSDDGVGFVVKRRLHAGDGLTNMSDRLVAVGGSLAIRSTPGEGTTVEGRVAIDAAGSEDGHA